MRERDIEKVLVNKVKDRGGLALKLNTTSTNGMPDRLVLLPSGKIGFVELKATGKQLRILQEKRKAKLEELGFLAFCVDSTEAIEEVLDEIEL